MYLVIRDLHIQNLRLSQGGLLYGLPSPTTLLLAQYAWLSSVPAVDEWLGSVMCYHQVDLSGADDTAGLAVQRRYFRNTFAGRANEAFAANNNDVSQGSCVFTFILSFKPGMSAEKQSALLDHFQTRPVFRLGSGYNVNRPEVSLHARLGSAVRRIPYGSLLWVDRTDLLENKHLTEQHKDHLDLLLDRLFNETPIDRFEDGQQPWIAPAIFGQRRLGALSASRSLRHPGVPHGFSEALLSFVEFRPRGRCPHAVPIWRIDPAHSTDSQFTVSACFQEFSHGRQDQSQDEC